MSIRMMCVLVHRTQLISLMDRVFDVQTVGRKFLLAYCLFRSIFRPPPVSLSLSLRFCFHFKRNHSSSSRFEGDHSPVQWAPTHLCLSDRLRGQKPLRAHRDEVFVYIEIRPIRSVAATRETSEEEQIGEIEKADAVTVCRHCFDCIRSGQQASGPLDSSSLLIQLMCASATVRISPESQLHQMNEIMRNSVIRQWLLAHRQSFEVLQTESGGYVPLLRIYSDECSMDNSEQRLLAGI